MSEQEVLTPPAAGVGMKWMIRGALTLICVLAVGLRLRMAMQLPLWLDDGITWGDCHLPLYDLLRWKFAQLPGPLYDFFARLSIACFGSTELALRLPSILFGIAYILLGFRIVARLNDEFTALLFSALLAVDPVLVRVDADARMYSLWLLLVLLSFQVIVGILRPLDSEPPAVQLRAGRWALLGLLLGLCFWTHPLALYFWASIAVAFLLVALRQPPSLRGSVLRMLVAGQATAFAIAIVISMPGLLKMVAIALHRRNPSAVANDLVLLFQTFAGSRFAALFYLAAGVGLWLFYRRNPNIAWHLISLAACAVLAVLVGNRIVHVSERYLYPAVLPLYFGLAFLCICMARRAVSFSPRVGPIAAGTLLTLLIAYRTSQTNRRCEAILQSAGGIYEAAHLIQYVAAHQDPSDLVVLLTPMLEDRADFYRLRGTRLTRTGDFWDREQPAFGYDLEALQTQSAPHVWLIIEPTWQKDYYEPERQLVAACAPLVRKTPFTDDEIQSILKEGVVRFSRDRIEGAEGGQIFKDVKTPLHPLLE